MRPIGLFIKVLLVLPIAAGSARAQGDFFGRDTLSGLLDLRVAAADGERSWLDGGFGKPVSADARPSRRTS